jgi:hypothetical protein
VTHGVFTSSDDLKRLGIPIIKILDGTNDEYMSGAESFIDPSNNPNNSMN